MEKKPPAPKEARKRMDDGTFLALATTLVTLTAIDFAIHWNGGVSDPEIREFFKSNLGNWINYVGNFGFSAAMSIVATAAQRIARHTDTIKGEDDLTDHVLDGFSHLAPGGIFALVLAVEGFSGNNHFWGDVTSTLLGIQIGQTVTRESLHRLNLGRHHSVRNKVDPLFPMKEIPTALPAWQYDPIQ